MFYYNKKIYNKQNKENQEYNQQQNISHTKMKSKEKSYGETFFCEKGKKTKTI